MALYIEPAPPIGIESSRSHFKFEALRQSAPETFKKQDFEENPAIKLLDFLEGLPRLKMPRLGTVETRKRSGLLRNMKAIEPQDVKRWMQQWGLE